MSKPKVPAWPFCIWCGIVGAASGGLFGRLGIRNSELRVANHVFRAPNSQFRTRNSEAIPCVQTLALSGGNGSKKASA